MADKSEARAKAMRAIQQGLFDRYELIVAQRPADHVDFDRLVMSKLRLVDAALDGFSQYELTVSKEFSNLNDVMHGGAYGVVFDMATTSALNPLARPDFYFFMGGVTRVLNISYLRGVPIGTVVLLSSKVIQIGKKMAMIKGEMTSLDGKTIYATAEHHKVNALPNPQHLEYRVPWDDEVEAEIQRQDKRETATKL
ncbi:thioesterase family protein-like protein [Phyllosticta paracitricarpa]|uniref:Thioesterase family protein-like protein n=1 Tax=Phyllosticta paracitricarpa TaxID=2016321 RepID=A0ABR1NCL9_9PEZI